MKLLLSLFLVCSAFSMEGDLDPVDAMSKTLYKLKLNKGLLVDTAVQTENPVESEDFSKPEKLSKKNISSAQKLKRWDEALEDFHALKSIFKTVKDTRRVNFPFSPAMIGNFFTKYMSEETTIFAFLTLEFERFVIRRIPLGIYPSDKDEEIRKLVTNLLEKWRKIEELGD